MKRNYFLNIFVSFFLVLILVLQANAETSSKVILDYQGGLSPTCTICGTPDPSFQCASWGTWDNGRFDFFDPVPAGNTVTHIKAEAYGVWGCMDDKPASNVETKLNDTEVQTRNTPEGSCSCGDCNMPHTYDSQIFSASSGGWPGYVYGGTNTWNMKVLSGDICVEKVVLTIFYEPDGLSGYDNSKSDQDNDGVDDMADGCPDTPGSDIVDSKGCTTIQYCLDEGRNGNHGEYVSCIAHIAKKFHSGGLITKAEKDAIVSAAAKSSVGKDKKSR